MNSKSFIKQECEVWSLVCWHGHLISVRGTFIVSPFLLALSYITLYKALSVYASIKQRVQLAKIPLCSNSRLSKTQSLIHIYSHMPCPERHGKAITEDLAVCCVIHGLSTHLPVKDPGKVQHGNKGHIWNPAHTFSPAVSMNIGPFCSY